MQADELRARFLEFCGPARFQKFATSLVKRCDEPAQFDRLRHWQELLWEQFRTLRPEAPSDVHAIGAALHWCHVHNQKLVRGSGHQAADLRRSDSFDRAMTDVFPHGFGWNVYHCPECRASCAQWIDDHPAECRMLQYCVHEAESVALRKDEREFRQAFQKANIPWDEIIPGDEIWAIDHGRGSTGFALVRTGRIVPLMD